MGILSARRVSSVLGANFKAFCGLPCLSWRGAPFPPFLPSPCPHPSAVVLAVSLLAWQRSAVAVAFFVAWRYRRKIGEISRAVAVAVLFIDERKNRRFSGGFGGRFGFGVRHVWQG